VIASFLFKNNRRLHLPSSKQRTSANIFNNGTNAGLTLSSCKRTVWNNRYMSLSLGGRNKTIQIYFNHTLYAYNFLILEHETQVISTGGTLLGWCTLRDLNVTWFGTVCTLLFIVIAIFFLIILSMGSQLGCGSVPVYD
jgi:hypothetical protein